MIERISETFLVWPGGKRRFRVEMRKGGDNKWTVTVDRRDRKTLGVVFINEGYRSGRMAAKRWIYSKVNL